MFISKEYYALSLDFNENRPIIDPGLTDKTEDGG